MGANPNIANKVSLNSHVNHTVSHKLMIRQYVPSVWPPRPFSMASGICMSLVMNLEDHHMVAKTFGTYCPICDNCSDAE